jgi:transposase
MQRDFCAIPDGLWSCIEKWIPKRQRHPAGGRSPIPNRVVMSGILYRLRTGCQWDAIPSEFGSGSTCYRRFVEWNKAGVFRMAYVEALLFYEDERGIGWEWASLDSASVKAPKGGTSRGLTRPIAASSAPSVTS